MSSTMDRTRQDFVVIDEPDGARFLLSRSAKEPQPLVGLYTLIGVLSIICVFLFCSTIAVLWGQPIPAALGNGSWILLLLTVGFLLFLSLSLLALHRARGTDELILTSRDLRAVHRLGPIRWSKSVRLGVVRQFKVVRGALNPNKPDEAFHTLKVEVTTGSDQCLISPYPRSLLLALAQELSVRSKLLREDLADELDGAGKRPVGEDSDIPTEIGERYVQPGGSRIRLESSEDGLIFRSTAMRIFEPGGHWILLIPCSIAGLVAMIFLMIAMFGGPGQFADLRFVLPFSYIVITICAMISCLTMGLIYRGWKLTVTPSRLILEQETILSKRQRNWSRDEIGKLGVTAEIVPDSDGNPTHMMSLQLVPHARLQEQTGAGNPKPTLLLIFHTKAELEWIATTIRSVLDVPAI